VLPKRDIRLEGEELKEEMESGGQHGHPEEIDGGIRNQTKTGRGGEEQEEVSRGAREGPEGLK
jgi:hypothetical protein